VLDTLDSPLSQSSHADDHGKGETMKILRDESGYVLVLRGLQVLPGGKATVEAKTSPAPVEVISAPGEANCSVPHCCFYCAWCGHPILLPNDRIGSPFGNPEARKIDVRSIATVCGTCKHIGNYSMFRSCRGFDTRHKIMHAPSCGETALLYWLQCVESSCPLRVPLFVKLEGDAPPGEAEAAEWLWDDLTCASGHSIQQISLDPRYCLPLRTPAGPH
jgi:hypothetical protein